MSMFVCLSVDSQRFSARVHSENRRRAAAETTEEELRSAERPQGGSVVESLSLMSEDDRLMMCVQCSCVEAAAETRVGVSSSCFCLTGFNLKISISASRQ